jgi:hypothetical protein
MPTRASIWKGFHSDGGRVPDGRNLKPGQTTGPELTPPQTSSYEPTEGIQLGRQSPDPSDPAGDFGFEALPPLRTEAWVAIFKEV